METENLVGEDDVVFSPENRSSLSDAVSAESLVFVFVSMIVLYAFECFVRNSAFVVRFRMDHFDDKMWKKARQAMVKFIWHFTNTCFLWAMIWDLGYLGVAIWPRGSFSEKILVNPVDYGFSRPRKVTLIFLVQFAHYLANGLYWVTFEAEKEFFLMIFHHIITGALLIFCNMGDRMWLGGLVILAITETTDAVLPGVKLWHYTCPNVSKIPGFIMFFAAYTYFRIFWFMWMIYQIWAPSSALFEGMDTDNDWDFHGIDWLPKSRAGFEFSWAMFMITIFQVMHFIWFEQILRSLVGSLRAGQIVDSRHDVEDYEQKMQELETPGGGCCNGKRKDD